MPAFDTVRESRSEKKYETATNTNLSESNSSETKPIMNAHLDDIKNESEARIPTQEEVDEQIRNVINPLNKQLEDLTQLTQGMSTAHRPDLVLGTSASFSAAGPSPDDD